MYSMPSTKRMDIWSYKVGTRKLRMCKRLPITRHDIVNSRQPGTAIATRLIANKINKKIDHALAL